MLIASSQSTRCYLLTLSEKQQIRYQMEEKKKMEEKLQIITVKKLQPC